MAQSCMFLAEDGDSPGEASIIRSDSLWCCKREDRVIDVGLGTAGLVLNSKDMSGHQSVAQVWIAVADDVAQSSEFDIGDGTSVVGHAHLQKTALVSGAPRPTPAEALSRLVDGNTRYQKDALIHPNRTPERRESLTAHQEPFAIIVGCADSRVSPELVFDQGVGDLFVVRVAGNVIGPLELDSIDYAAIYLHASSS